MEQGNLQGGVQKVTTDLCSLMVSRYGAEVTLMVSQDADDALCRLASERGFAVAALGARRRYSPSIVWKYIKYIRCHKPDIVHVNHTLPHILVAMASLACPRKIVFIATEHSIDSVRRDHGWFRGIDKWIYNRYRKTICISNAVRQRLMAWLQADDPSRYDVVYNGIDTHSPRHRQPCERQHYGFTADDVVMVSVGRLTEGKDFATFIKALPLLPENYKALIVGDGPLHEQLTRLADSLGVRHRLVMAGFVADVTPLLKMSDIFVSTSLSEGFGLSVVEAMAAGLPVVATRIEVFEELLPADHLFEKKDAKALAVKIENIDGLSPVSEDIVDQFSLDNMAANYHKIYQNLV